MPSRIPFTPEEEQRVVAALASFPARDRCLILLGLNTGYRASELSAIRVGDVWTGDDVRTELTVSRRFLKGGHGVRRRSVRSRCVPLNRSARDALREYLSARRRIGSLDFTMPLFPSQRKGHSLQRWQVNRIVHRAAEIAGVRTLARIGCHTLRKTFCRKVYAASNHDIFATCALMGHRYVTTTQAYLEVDADRLRATVLAIG